MSFWRNPSARWPKTSWKKTAAARPVSKRGPGVGIDERRVVERFRFLNHRLDVLEDGLVVGSVFGIEPVEIGVAVDVHAVRSFALHVELEAVVNLAEGELGAFAIHLY